ncbi:MAG: hypothetical protein Kow0074_03470 [Candidatus Zixiibacteriota bacterium]
MRCTLIKQHLSDPDRPLRPELANHMRACTQCRDLWEAEQAIRRSISAVRAEDIAARMGTAAVWVDRVAADEEESFVSSIVRHPFSTRGRRLGWTLSVLTVALALFVLVPFSYEHTIGTEVAIPTNAALLHKIDVSAIEARLAENGYNAVQVTTGTDNDIAILTLRVPGSGDAARAVVAAAGDLLPAPLEGAEVTLAPWRVRESGSLLARMTNTFIVSVNVEGKSETEIADEIRAQLQSQGMQVDNLWISKDGSQTTMTLEGGAPGATGEQKFEVHLFDDESGGDQQFTTKILVENLDPNLSEQEKIAEIKRQLEAEGIHNADVTIDGDNVKIELEEEK